MRPANIFALVTVGVWLGMLWIGMGLLKGVVARDVLGYPAAGQIDFLVGIPVTVIAVVVAAALLTNIANRFWIALHVVCGAALLALVPYLFVYGGGV